MESIKLDLDNDARIQYHVRRAVEAEEFKERARKRGPLRVPSHDQEDRTFRKIFRLILVCLALAGVWRLITGKTEASSTSFSHTVEVRDVLLP